MFSTMLHLDLGKRLNISSNESGKANQAQESEMT